MKLADYGGAWKEFFIDVNIFIFHANVDVTFGDSCTAFLRWVGEGENFRCCNPCGYR
jgi:hypothetical protein